VRDSEAIRKAASLQYLANSVRKFERGHCFYTPRESVPEAGNSTIKRMLLPVARGAREASIKA